MEQGNGKCKTCGKPTNPMRKGGFFELCTDCYGKQQTTLPEKSMQEQMNDIITTFEYAFKRMGEIAPGMTPELKVECAISLNDHYWKNHRTPK